MFAIDQLESRCLMSAAVPTDAPAPAADDAPAVHVPLQSRSSTGQGYAADENATESAAKPPAKTFRPVIRLQFML